MRGLVILFRGVVSLFVTLVKEDPDGSTVYAHKTYPVSSADVIEDYVTEQGFEMKEAHLHGQQKIFERKFYD